MNDKIKLAVLMGGPSPEHEISLVSTRNVLKALDPTRYSVTLIGIDFDSRWYIEALLSENPFAFAADLRTVSSHGRNPLALIPGSPSRLLDLASGETIDIDIIFPLVHGPFGEDGTLQGLLEVLNIAYVGSGPLASAQAMDKLVTKKLLSNAGLPTARFVSVDRYASEVPSYQDVAKDLGATLYVKASCMGSSVGVHRITSQAELAAALADAFLYGEQVLIEEAIDGREIEIAVLGNSAPETAEVAGEIVVAKDFYSYTAKYLDESLANLKLPAPLEPSELEAAQNLAKRAFQELACAGMARVDLFLTTEGFIVNEVNTIPGFTKISMYPSMWAHSGIDCSALIDRLVALGFERHKQKNLRKLTR